MLLNRQVSVSQPLPTTGPAIAVSDNFYRLVSYFLSDAGVLIGLDAAEVIERLRADIDIADITRGNRNAFPDSLLQGLSLADGDFHNIAEVILQADEGFLLGGRGRRDGRIQEEDSARLARAPQVKKHHKCYRQNTPTPALMASMLFPWLA